MRTTLATLGLAGILICFCSAQESATAVATNATASDTVTPGIPKATPPAADTILNRQVIEATARFELLNQLAQEHRKRAEETPRDQGRYQWESELAKELGDRASAILSLLNQPSKERLASEPAAPDLTVVSPPNSVTGATHGPSPEEIAFLEALAERRTTVQQELAAAGVAANLYAMRLATNNSNNSYESSTEIANIHYLMRDNGYSVKQLQKELFDLELKNLEFRALRKQ